MIDEVNVMAGIVQGVNDEACAKTVIPRLQEHATRLDELQKQAEALPVLSKQEACRLSMEMGTDLISIRYDLCPECH